MGEGVVASAGSAGEEVSVPHAAASPYPSWTESPTSTPSCRQGAPWLKTDLVQAAWSAARKKGSYPRAQFLRLKGRCGPKKAIVAVAASLLTAA